MSFGRSTIALLCALFIGSLPVAAEVYWILPFSRSDIAGTVAGIPGVTSSKAFFRERVIYNGVSAELEVWTSTASLAELEQFFKRTLPGAVVSRYGRMLKIISRNSRGRILCSGGAHGGAVVFLLSLSGTPATERPVWPDILPPLAAGEQADTVIAFPDRRAVFGAVSAAGGGGAEDPVFRLRRTASRLRSSGWTPAGHEDSTPIGGSGDIYISHSPRRIMLVSYDRSGNGIYYLREEKK